MKTTALILAIAAIAALGGYWLGQRDPGATHVTEGAASASGEREILYYKAPMDPNYRRDEPGKSPMGMDLVPVYADEAEGGDAGTVRISPTVVNNLGVRTAPVARGALAREIETVGYVGYDEDTLHKISTRVDGWIEQLNVAAAGDPVQQGDVLFELYSPALVNAQQEYLVALNSSNSGLQRASRERLVALGLGPAEITRLQRERKVRQRIRVTAPSAGVVAHLGVREGAYVTPATDILSIGVLDEVWLLAEIFERQSGWVRNGQQATISLDALPGVSRAGVVDYVYPELDPKTRTVTARIRLDNADKSLKPNMFARARITGDVIDAALHVPREAVVRGGRVDRVVVVNDDGSFRAQPVTVGIESGDRVQIVDGIDAGDEVVTSGQFLIDSESNIDTALRRMDASARASDGMAQDMTVATAAVMATVKAVDQDDRSITLQHGPIEAWSMPGMTMVFDVAPDIELDTVAAGDAAHVEIERHGSSHFLVTALHAMTGAGEQSAAHDGHGDTESAATADTASVMATVRAVDAGNRMITLQHGPIEAWSMPGMTMVFDVAAGIDLGDVAAGDTAHVEVERRDDGAFVVTKLHPMSKSDAMDGMQHGAHGDRTE